MFVEHQVPDDIEDAVVAANGSLHLPAVLAELFGVSRSDARRVLGQGGVRVDGEPLPAEPLDVEPSVLDGKVVQLGKRSFRRVRVAP